MIFRGVSWNERVVLRFMVMAFPNVHLLVYTTPNGYPIAREMYMIYKKCRHYMHFSKLD